MISVLMRALVCAYLAPIIIAASSPGTFEVDLIFPRNGTWAPADTAMPIVFAVQRPDLAPSFAIGIVSWILLRAGAPERQEGVFYMPDFDGSDDKPYFIPRIISDMSGIEDSWSLHWSFYTTNCTSSRTNSSLSSYADPSSYIGKQYKVVSEFKTSKSAPSANWTALTSAQDCAGSDGVAFPVTEILEVIPRTGWPGFNASCAEFSSTTTPNPCAVRIDAAAASSVSASLAHQVCVDVNGTASGKCPMPSSSNRVTASWQLAAILCSIGLAMFQL
jgi:hypothetical protein